VRLPAGYASRPATGDDLDALVGLFNACDRADVGFEDPVREHLEEDWRAPAFDLSTSSLMVLAADGTLVAYAQVSGHNPEFSLDGYGRVHPGHRRRGLGASLVEWMERRASADAPPKVFNAIPSSDEAARDLLSHRGYARARTFLHMEIEPARAVSSVPPEGIVIRPYRHDVDVKPVYDTLEEAFQDHWGHEPYPFDLHVEQMSRVDPRLAPVATEGGQVVGAAVGRVLEDVGWIDVVGVRRPWRGRGIARALLSRSFEGFSALQTTSVRLNVDAESLTGATRLYESVGMRVRRGFDVFEKRLGVFLPPRRALPADIS
jgi:mycothiol synthase